MRRRGGGYDDDLLSVPSAKQGLDDKEEALRHLLSTTTITAVSVAHYLPASSSWRSQLGIGAGIPLPSDADGSVPNARDRFGQSPDGAAAAAAAAAVLDPSPHKDDDDNAADAAPTPPLIVMSSTLKKRRAKMNKHKLRKRRKLMRLKSK
jgi:Mitochondrial domain of unknown function (DUF1713)